MSHSFTLLAAAVRQAAVASGEPPGSAPSFGFGITIVVFIVLAIAVVAVTTGQWTGSAGMAAAPTAPAGAVRRRFGGDPEHGPSLGLKLAAATAAGGLILVVGLLAYVGLWQYRVAADWVDHTNEVRSTLARVPATLAEAEAAARGYILSGRPELLAEYGRAVGATRQAADAARRLTTDNPAQQRRLAALPPLMDRRLAVLDDYIGQRRAGGVAAVTAIAEAGGRPSTSRGLSLSDSVRGLVAAADQAEAGLLGTREGMLVRRGRLLTVVLLGGSLTAFALILLITQAIRRDVALREAAQRRVEEQANELAAQAEQLELQQTRLEEQLEEQQVLSEELTETNGELAAAQAAQAAALDDTRREEARYRALVEAGAQIVWSTSPTGAFTTEQPGWAAFTGQARAEYEGRGWLDAVHPDDRDATAAAWDEAIAAGTSGRLHAEHRLRRRDGVYRRMSLRAVPVRDDGQASGSAAAPGSTTAQLAVGADRVREWVGVHVDVTGERLVQAQREALIRALERSNRDLDQFAYVASHDLKAPLRGISNLSSWIEEDLAAVMTPDAREQMGLLRGRVHRMEALIDGVLQYSRAGRVRAPAERVDTAALVREVVELLAPRPGARVDAGPGLPAVTAERVPLQQVLLNLVGNALKYATRDDAVVAVDATPAAGPEGEPAGAVRGADAAEAGRVGGNGAGGPAAPGWYRFTVADNGPGIAPQYHERVFGIFQTLQSRDRVEGTGIGLSVVKKIVEGQGGRVWVESAAGEGARFHFTWPAAPPADAPAA